MEKNEFEKYRYITYIDEVINYTIGEVSYYSIVSISMPKEKYINELENKWRDLRKEFSIPDGVCLHFTDIKALLNPTYFNRNDKERNSEMESIFCDGSHVNKEVLVNFYNKVIDIIESTEMDIIVTGKRFEKNYMVKNSVVNKYINTQWYVLFKDHLDALAKYMLDKSYEKYSSNTSRNKKFKMLKTKLRYDGDYGLTSRDSLRDVYAHVISNGTTNYNNKLAKECFDNLKFVDKQEVGLCNLCENDCDIKKISHAGNEILDFIALYASNVKCKDFMVNDYEVHQNNKQMDGNSYYNKKIKIYIEETSIYPYEKIKNKILK